MAARLSLLALVTLALSTPPVRAQELPPADSLIREYVEAIGGREAYLSATSVRTIGTVQIQAMGLTGEFELLQLAPDRSLLRAIIPGVGEIVNAYDGEVGWNIDPLTGPRVLDGAELEARAERASFLGVLRDPSIVPERETVELTERGGRECWRVRLVWSSGRESFDCYSAESGLLVASEETQMSQMGEIEVSLTYDDYREVEGGVRLPMKVVQEGMGQSQLLVVDEVELDPLDPADFEPPQAIRTLLDGGA